MSKSNTLETGILALVFNNTDLANIGNAGGLRGATVAGSLYVSLHIGDPGEAGTQTTNETTYSGYARVAVARTAGGWAVSGGVVSPVAAINFPECTSGTATITHFGIGTDASGAGTLLYSGTVTPNISVATGVIPSLKTTSTITED